MFLKDNTSRSFFPFFIYIYFLDIMIIVIMFDPWREGAVQQKAMDLWKTSEFRKQRKQEIRQKVMAVDIRYPPKLLSQEAICNHMSISSVNMYVYTDHKVHIYSYIQNI